tara:strand:- start:3102 stop:3872 length:771 start_codon:yes stop_codon:yes gene_type:complete
VSVCILASDDLQSRAMLAGIAKDHDVSAVIIEKKNKAAIIKTLRYRIRRLGYKKVVGQLLLLAYDKLFLKRKSLRIIREILSSFDDLPVGVPVYIVENVNSQRTLELLEYYQPSLCVVTGTSIIRSEVLNRSPMFLNIHCGVTPRYRGVHGGFWAVAHEDFSNIGVTIHKIDAGVDTGSIVFQQEVAVSTDFETHRTLAAKQYKVGIPLMSKAVNDALASKLKFLVRDDLNSKQWFSPTLGDYFRFKRNLKKIKSL